MKEYSLLRKINESQWSNDSGSKPGSFYAGEEFTPTMPLRYRRPMPPRTPSLRAVAPPNSRAEKEANDFASKYINRSSETKRDTGKISDISPVTGNTTTIQASGSEGGFALNQAQESHVNSALQSEGTPLPEKDRTSLEQHTGHDLSDVRVHTGDAAERAATSINAKAFTVGKDIVFGKGEYRPGSKDGDHLLAHEVAHTLQGNAGIHRYTSPLDWLDYIGLTYDAAERIYLLNFYKGDDKDFQLAMNSLFTALDVAFAIAPGIGGGGVGARASHGTLALAWDAMPASVRREAVKSVADQMGWTIAKAGQFINMMARTGGGWDDVPGARGGGRKGPKRDIGQIDDVAKEFKMDKTKREAFGEYIEELKADGFRGSLNSRGDFTYAELRKHAIEFLH